MLILTASALLGLTGCQTSLFDWGKYNQSIQRLYTDSSDTPADVGKDIKQLAKEIKKTEAKRKANSPSRVPPGKYAHLGYLYAIQGDQIMARESLENEKRIYPEASIFVDGMLRRMK